MGFQGYNPKQAIFSLYNDRLQDENDNGMRVRFGSRRLGSAGKNAHYVKLALWSQLSPHILPTSLTPYTVFSSSFFSSFSWSKIVGVP